jgi:hypothetical protein
MGRAQYSQFERTYIKEQDMIEEYRVDRQQLAAAVLIATLAFSIDLVINWISWQSPVKGVGLFLQSGSVSAISVDFVGLFFVVVTVWGIPTMLKLALQESQRTSFFITTNQQNQKGA